MMEKQPACLPSQKLSSQPTKESSPAHSPFLMHLCFVFCSSYQFLAKSFCKMTSPCQLS